MLTETDVTSVKVTPAMVEAGYRVLQAAGLTDDLLEADRLVVVEIFQAMVSLGPRSIGPK
jgi:hypothetical protein